MKKRDYSLLKEQIEGLVSGNQNLVSILANTSAALHEFLGSWWTGFYLVDDAKEKLWLGPFQGPVACTEIDKGKGVCGTSWEQEKAIIVPDVHKFEGHIACSSETNSEIVIPLVYNQRVWAVLDVDSKNFNEFDTDDEENLTLICQSISSHAFKD